MIALILNLVHGITRPQSIISCKNYRNIIKNIIQISKEQEKIVIANDAHDRKDKEFNNFPPHCLNFSYDCLPLEDVISDIKIQNKNITCVSKHTHSAIKNKFIYSLIEKNNGILLCGFSTHTDILFTALDLIELGHEVYIKKECCGSFIEDSEYIFQALSIQNVRVV